MASVFNENVWSIPLTDFLVTLAGTGPARRGQAYASEGRVLDLAMKGGQTLVGTVEGSEPEPYEVVLSVADGALESNCSCPFAVDCKHGYAVALMVAAEALRRGAGWAREIEDLLPKSWRGANANWGGCSHLRSALEAMFGREGSVKAPAPHAKKASGSGRGKLPVEWWREYLAAESAAEKRALLLWVAKARLADFYSPWYLEQLLFPYRRVESPLEQLRHFEKALAQFAQQNRRKPPAPDPGLEAFLESAEARALEREYFRRQAETSLLEWLKPAQSTGTGDRAYVETVWLAVEPETSEELPSLCFQMLLTTKKLRGEPRSSQGIELLSREVAGGRRQLAEGETRLVRWLVRQGYHQAGYQRLSLTDTTVIPVQNALEWLTTWGEQGLLRWAEGGPVVLDPAPARLTVSRGDEGPAVWAVEFPAHGNDPGGQVALSEAELMADSPGPKTGYGYYAKEDEEPRVFARRGDVIRLLDTGGMPSEVLATARRVPEVPVERLRGTAAGALLAQRLSLHRDREDLVQEVPVVPMVSCVLEGTSLVRLSAQAKSELGAEFRWTHSGEWEYRTPGAAPESELEELEGEAASAVEAAETPAVAAQAIALLPRREDVEPVNAWLAQVARVAKFVTAEDGSAAMEWRVKGKELYDLLQVWAERPRGVTYLGNRPFRNLVTPGRAPGVRVSVEPSGTEWLKVSVEMEKEIDALPMSEVVAALEAGQAELVYLSGGRLYRREDLEAYRRNVQVLEEMGIEVEPGEQRLHALQLAGTGAETLAEISDGGDYLRELAERTRGIVKRFKGVPPAKIPATTAVFLRPYQRSGTDFLVWSARTFGGAVLADDMGLGKTLQVLAALSALHGGAKKKLPSLVVCPASVAHNWQREAQRFAPHLRVVVIERGEKRKGLLERLGEFDVVIKNYSLTRRDADILRAQEWMAVCVDEAQAIKNPAADITRTVKSIPAKYRFALTGTPIENRLTDLWSIVDFVVPGYLHALTRFEQRLRAQDPRPFQRLVRARLRPVLLRRTKAEVAPELPPRIEERRDCEMSVSQRKAYITEVQKTRLLLDGFSANGGKKAGQDRIRMLAALTRLRQICCDPALVGLPDKGSGKVDQLMELLPPILEEGHKVLLFSQFVRMLKRLEKALKAKKIPTRMLTGETNNRQDLVDAFERDPEPGVFLISLKAGGVGLNLPSASHVILFDPWWNPAVEAQAIDRTHRIGQDKTVIAFRLVAAGTVEERILELQERKRGLVTQMLEEEAFNRSLSKEDFEYLLKSDL